ncbi:MAG: protein BatD [Cocleimonas sp.]|nr:protein BatD [Cocleimonas sp.]
MVKKSLTPLKISIIHLLFLLSFIYSVSLPAAELTVHLDRSELTVDEDFELTIASNSVNSGKIDLSPLEQDFEIIDRYRQSSVHVLNGEVKQATTWTLTLAAKHAGNITIPTLIVGNDSTKKIKINVKETHKKNKDQNIIVEATIKKTSTYVQGQFIYEQNLYFSKPFRENSSLTRPRLTSGRAEIEALGTTPKRIVQYNGKEYNLITRRFSIIPQESGRLTLAPSIFSGTLRRESQRSMNNSFVYSTRSKRIRVRSKAVSIDVKPRPIEFTGKDWIIAKDFSMHINWSIPPTDLKAGDPITLVLGVIVDGLKAEQLPEINLQAPDGIKLYPEKPSFQNTHNMEGIVGTMNKNIVLISMGGGEFKLPALSIPWWNSESNQQEIATIKATTLNVSGSPAPVIKAQKKQLTITQPAHNPTPLKISSELSNSLIIIVSMASLLLLLATGWFIFIVKKVRFKPLNPFTHWQNKQGKKHPHDFLDPLEQACLNNNSIAAQQALQHWARTRGLVPATLVKLGETTHPELQHQIEQLNQVLYSKTKLKWKGAPLWQAVEAYQRVLKTKTEVTKGKSHHLKPLYR